MKENMKPLNYQEEFDFNHQTNNEALDITLSDTFMDFLGFRYFNTSIFDIIKIL